MKKLFVILALLLATLLITGCELDLNQFSSQGPTVEINEPASGVRVLIGHEIEIESRASDKAMIERIEMYINGDLIREDFPPIETGQENFSVLQRWVPVEPGQAQVRVIAYNKKGEASSPTGIVLQVYALPTATPVPTATPTMVPPTATATIPPTATPTMVPPTATAIPPTATITPTLALAMPTAGPLRPEIQGTVDGTGPLNIRAGPGANTARVSWLNANSFVTGIARNGGGNWAKIRFGPNNQEGWVLAQRIRWQGNFQSLPIE